MSKVIDSFKAKLPIFKEILVLNYFIDDFVFIISSKADGYQQRKTTYSPTTKVVLHYWLRKSYKRKAWKGEKWIVSLEKCPYRGHF